MRTRHVCVTYFLALIGLGTLSASAQLSPSILHSFSSASPNWLIQAEDGNLYGTTTSGGNGQCFDASSNQIGCGFVFRVSPSGDVSTLYSFCPQNGCVDGSWPM